MSIAIVTRPPQHPDAERLLRAYIIEIVSRWHGRPATPTEVQQTLAEEPSADLVAPNGYLAVVEVEDAPVGIGGLRLIDRHTAELTKIFIERHARGRGLASILLDHLETEAALRSRSQIRLDTRSDLVEACHLYERRGYLPVPPFNDCPYSDRWYALNLAG